MPGPALGAARERRPARHQRVHEGVVPVPRRGMHHQPGRLVDDGQVLVFVDDGERDGGGLEGPGRLVLGESDGHPLAAGEERGRRGPASRSTSTALPATSRAAWVRERPS